MMVSCEAQRSRSNGVQKECAAYPGHSLGCPWKYCLLSLPDVGCLGQSHDFTIPVATIPLQLGVLKRQWPPRLSHTFRLAPSVFSFCFLVFIEAVEVTGGWWVIRRDVVVPAKYAAFGHWACPVIPG